MRLFAVFVSCSLVLAAQTPSPQDPPLTNWRFAQPDALLVGSIHPKALIESPVLQEAIKQGAPQDASGAQVTAMLGLAKGLLSEINEVRFSLVQTGEPGKQKMEFVALIDGHFDESVLALLAAGAPSPDKLAYHRIDANTLLVGQGPSLDQAVQRMTQSEPKLRSRAFEGTETLVTNDFWISGQMPENPFALLTNGLPLPAGLKPSTTPDLSKNLRGIALGVSLHDGIDGELVLQTATAEMAEALVKEALASSTQRTDSLSHLLGARAEGTTAHFTINVPRSTALDAIRTAMDQRKSVAANTTTIQPLTPPKPVRRTVVIEGLDEGTREVQLPQQNR